MFSFGNYAFAKNNHYPRFEITSCQLGVNFTLLIILEKNGENTVRKISKVHAICTYDLYILYAICAYDLYIRSLHTIYTNDLYIRCVHATFTYDGLMTDILLSVYLTLLHKFMYLWSMRTIFAFILYDLQSISFAILVRSLHEYMMNINLYIRSPNKICTKCTNGLFIRSVHMKIVILSRWSVRVKLKILFDCLGSYEAF